MEELADDIRQARQPQVQVRQQEVLGGGPLRVHRRVVIYLYTMMKRIIKHKRQRV